MKKTKKALDRKGDVGFWWILMMIVAIGFAVVIIIFYSQQDSAIRNLFSGLFG